MNDLSPQAAALIRAGRTAFRPDPADRDRVLASLGAALGEAAVSDGAHDAARANAAPASGAALPTWVVGGLAAAALATGVVLAPHLWTRPSSRAVAVAAPPVEAPPRVDPASSDVGLAVDRPPTAHGAGLPRAGSRTTRTPSDSLPEEVHLLALAEQQMNDGRAADALKTLGEHERRFPAGALAEERMAARVHALCAIGRGVEAESELTKLTRAYPRSPLLEHARAVCGMDLGSRP